MVLLACAGPARQVRPTSALPYPRGRPGADLPATLFPLPDGTRRRLVERAASLVGHRRAFEVRGVRFRGDCSGFVEAVYQAEGIPFREALSLAPEDGDSSVAAIYRSVSAHGILFSSEIPPLPGDLVFFNDTYDRNGNGELDDPLTHMGIVEEILEGGTVTFLHRGSRGVARGRMTLDTPDVARDASGEVLNTRLRLVRRSDPDGTRYLAGQLFAAFGRFDPPLLAAALDGSDRLSLDALGLGEGGPEELPLPGVGAQRHDAPVEDEGDEEPRSPLR